MDGHSAVALRIRVQESDGQWSTEVTCMNYSASNTGWHRILVGDLPLRSAFYIPVRRPNARVEPIASSCTRDMYNMISRHSMPERRIITPLRHKQSRPQL